MGIKRKKGSVLEEDMYEVKERSPFRILSINAVDTSIGTLGTST